MGLHVTNKGSWSKTRRLLTRNTDGAIRQILERYGEIGVQMLSEATPVDSGITSMSWYYQIRNDGTKSSLYFCNSNVNDGVPIAIILQYGHGTSTGGWVEGRDYINPAIKPIFDALSNSIWKEVSSE